MDAQASKNFASASEHRGPLKTSQWAVIIMIAAAVGSYYSWGVRAAGNRFVWGRDLGGYYNYLGRAFSQGHLYVPIQPSPELLASPNPWDPAVDDSYKMHDMALFNGRYYLYHGPGPALLLFTPWRLITGHDLPENFALLLLCFGGFLFSCAALVRLLTIAEAAPSLWQLAVMLLALGICQCIPYLLNRVWVYEVAIGGGYFFVSGALYFLVRSIESRRIQYWLAASGLMFGLAIACRPTQGLAAAAAFAGLVVCLKRSKIFDGISVARGVIAFLGPLGLLCAAVGAYNYVRFGSPLEFGIRYLLAGANQNRLHLSFQNLLPGLYFLLFSPPDFSPVFPWVQQVFRYPFNAADYPFPPGYFVEPTVGALYTAPFVTALLIPSARDAASCVRILLGTMVAACAAILLFLSATGFTTHRYEVDFVPPAVLAAIASAGIYIARSSGVRRVALQAALALTVAYSGVVNLALGISGPYGDMFKNRPISYVRIARWFSPVDQFRPRLNPRLTVDFTAEFKSQPYGFDEPLITIGSQPYGHFVYVEHLPGKLRVVSKSNNSTVAYELEEAATKPIGIRVTFSPRSGMLATAMNGRMILAHEIGNLLTAPSQVVVGENRIDGNVSARRFTGRIYGLQTTVEDSEVIVTSR